MVEPIFAKIQIIFKLFQSLNVESVENVASKNFVAGVQIFF